MLSGLPGVFMTISHYLPHLSQAEEMGGAGVVSCLAGIWCLMKNRPNAIPDSDRNTPIHSRNGVDGGEQTSAMYCPPPDPNAYTNNSDYATALAGWNLAEMHQINLNQLFRF